MQPAIIILAYYFGASLSLTTIFIAFELVEWVSWPINMIPHFVNSYYESCRVMRRLQKFHMIDEIQEGLIERKDSSWGRNAIEVKGNFSWKLDWMISLNVHLRL